MEQKTLDDLKRDQKNPRYHGQRNRGLIEHSLRRLGAARSGVIDENGVILAGNGTYDALRAVGIDKVKVVPTDGKEWVVVQRAGLSEEEKRELAIADNRSGELAEWDPEGLAGQGIDLAPWFTAAELAAITGQQESADDAGPDPGDDIAAALQAKWHTAGGQLWEMPSTARPGGFHRLLIGDSTSKADVGRLMGKDLAALVFTDPPYGVSYQSASGKHTAIANDSKQRNDLSAFLTEALRRMAEFSRDNAAFYIWHASSTRDDFSYAMKAAGLEEIQYLIWVKPAIVLGHSDYQWSHEPCFYASKAEQRPAFYGGRAQSTVWRLATPRIEGEAGITIGTGILISDGRGPGIYVAPNAPKSRKLRHFRLDANTRLILAPDSNVASVWEVSRDKAKPLHPTQKPIALGIRAMGNSSAPGEVVLDLFSGSGSTTIAAERTGRLCRAMELDPRYAAVTLEWAQSIGLTPVLHSSSDDMRPKPPEKKESPPEGGGNGDRKKKK